MNARNKAESRERLRFPSPFIEFCSVFFQQEGCVFKLAITRPIVLDNELCIVLSLWCVQLQQPHAVLDPAHSSSRSHRILTLCKPMGLSLCSWLLLLASHHMAAALTKEHKDLSRINQEIEIF